VLKKISDVSANKKTFRACTNDKGRKVIRGTTLIAASFEQPLKTL